MNQDQFNEIKRLTGSKDRQLGEVEISASGTKIAHGLHTAPKWVQCIPYKSKGMVSTSWWYYQKPDANYIYIQAMVTGRFLVTVGG